MAIELEGLEFQIESSAEKADRGLRALHGTLLRIRKAVSGGLGLNTVVEEIDNVTGKATRNLNKLRKACEKLTSNELHNALVTMSIDFQFIGDNINKIDVERVKELSAALKVLGRRRLPNLNPTSTSGETTAPAGDVPATAVDSGVEEVSGQVEEATEQVSGLHNRLSGLGGVFKRTFQTGVGTLRTFGKVVRSVGSGIKALGKAATVLPKKLGSGFAAKIKHTTSTLGQFFASIKRIAMYRLIRTALKAITQGFSEGVKNLYHWSDALGGTFAKSMDKLATDAQYLKNSLAAMAAPLINALAPAIDFITDKIIDFMNYVNQLIAKLTGASTYTVAKKVAAEWDDASKKTKKATDEIKRYTLGFDELNILGKKDKDTDSSSKKETDYSKMFETKQVDSSISDVTKKLKAMFDVLKQAWAQEGLATINAAKAAFDSFKDLISDIGDTIYRVFTAGYGFDWAVSALQLFQSILGVVTVLNTTFKTAWNDHNKGYTYIASIFNMLTSVNNLLAKIATAFRNAWNNGIGVQIWTNILDIVTSCNNIVANLADSISRAWDKAGLGEQIWNGVLTIVNTVLTSINYITTATESWASRLDFEPILKAFNDLLVAINPVVEKITGGLAWAYDNVLLPVGKWTIEAGLPVLIGLLSAAFGVLNSVLEGLKEPALYIWENFIKPIGEWTGGVIVSVLTSLSNVLQKLSDWIDTHKEAFDAIVETVGAFVAGWLGAKAVIGIISGITTAGSLLIGGLGTLAASFNPVVLAIEAVIAIGVLLYQHWDEIKEAAINLRDKIVEKWAEISNAANELADKVYKACEPIRNWSEGFVKDIVDGFNKIPENWNKLGEDATTLWNAIKSNVSNVWDTISTNCTSTFETISGNISSAWDTATERLKGFVTWVKNTFSVDWESAWNYVVGLFGTVFNKMGELMKTPINSVIDLMNWMIDKIETAINSVVNGINNHLKIHIDPIYVFGNKIFGGLDWGAHLQTVQWSRIQKLATGGILDEATLFGMMGRKGLVGGEAGREAVLPLETHTEWMDTLADKVRAGISGDNANMSEYVRQGMMDATARQNDLLREQNDLLRKIYEKELVANVSTSSIIDGLSRKNLRDGKTVVPIG